MTIYSDICLLEIIKSVKIGIIWTKAQTPEVSPKKSSALLHVSTCCIKSKSYSYIISIISNKGLSNWVVIISQISLKQPFLIGSSALWHSMFASIWF